MDRRGLGRLAAVAGLAALLAAAPAAGQESAPSSARADDPAVADARLKTGDCVGIEAKADEEGIAFDVEMAVPLEDGLYTRAVVTIDCDDDAHTGVDGCELKVTAAVGSRFGPNRRRAAEPGVAGPMELLACSYAIPGRRRVVGSDGGESQWILQEPLAPPSVEGKHLRFRVPSAMMRPLKSDYHSRFRWSAEVVTLCCEQPVLVEHVCSDEGLMFTVDGSDQEWTGSTVVEDAADELHADVLGLDIVRVRVDHSGKRLCVLVDFQKPGLADPFGTGRSDVRREDEVSIHVQPCFPAYGEPVTVVVPAGEPGSKVEGLKWAVRGAALEAGVARKSEQTRFRVTVWADARRIDRVPDSGAVSMELPR